MAPKAKTQKMSLGDFLGDQSLGSWADEMENSPVASDSRPGFGDRRAFSSTASYTDRGFARDPNYQAREPLPLPTKPPYTAHLGNLPFDAEIEHIREFFQGCDVTTVRLVEDKIERRPKGFGYVEFSSLEGLKTALGLNMEQFRGRNIKISVADPPKDRGDAREVDWTRKGPLPDLPNQRRIGSERGGPRTYEAPDMERSGSRRGPAFDGDGKVRDFGNWERKGPLSPLPGAEPMRTGGRVRPHDGPRERKNSPSWGEHTGSQDGGSRPPRQEFRDRPQPERVPTAAELDTEWRSRMRPDAPVKSKTPTPDPSTPNSPAPAPALAVRPKLNLAKRTVSEAEPSPATESKSSIFGGAKPIDTAAREKEVEEKRQQALKQKRDGEKVKEEKRTKEAAAKAAAEKASEENENTEEKSNGSDAQPGKNYQILQKTDEQPGESEQREAPEPNQNGNSPEDRPSRSRGGRDPPRGPKYSAPNWRKKPSNPSSPATPSADAPDEDGWSTVGPPKARGQRGRGGHPASTRPVAS